MEFNANPNRKVINVDLDGILTNGEKFWEIEPTPNLKTISTIIDDKYVSLNQLLSQFGLKLYIKLHQTVL